MKYLFSFLFGAAVGVGGTLLWLRKEIKKELKMRSEASNSDDVPFVMEEHNNEGKKPESLRDAKNGLRSETDVPVAVRRETKVEYNKIVNEVKSGVKPELKIPVLPREDYPEAHYEEEEEDHDPGPEKKDEPCFAIDLETYTHDNEYEKDHLVYFEGDGIMSTENGTVIDAPAMLVGVNWDETVGRDARRTAFVRNPKLNTDYEIYVEDGFYIDEYGPIDKTRED